MILHNIDGKAKQSETYSWASGTVNVAGVAAGTDLTGISGFTTLLSAFNGRVPHKIKVETDGAGYLSINGGPVITLGATSPFEASDLAIRTLTVSSGGAAVTFTVYLQ